jgi:hypothetical protein
VDTVLLLIDPSLTIEQEDKNIFALRGSSSSYMGKIPDTILVKFKYQK